MRSTSFPAVQYLAITLLTLTSMLSVISIAASRNENPPEDIITNGIITARLYLPDAKNGYYRGTRFDWSGVISSLDCNGPSYYGQWFDDYSPTNDDAITGPVEAFDPVDYNDVKPGADFLKIGVGMVKKLDTLPYNFTKFYPVVNGGTWTVTSGAGYERYEQILKDSVYAYDYQKTVQLIKGKPMMVLMHTFKNTGTKTIETTVFDHNFLVLDDQLTGPGDVVTFPVTPTGPIDPHVADLAKLKGNQLIFLKGLDKKHVAFKDMADGKACKYEFKVEDRTTGAAVRITGDRPVSKLLFWSAFKTLCPEPYIDVKVEPGQTFTWNITYEYYTCDTTKTK